MAFNQPKPRERKWYIQVREWDGSFCDESEFPSDTGTKLIWKEVEVDSVNGSDVTVKAGIQSWTVPIKSLHRYRAIPDSATVTHLSEDEKRELAEL